MDGDALTAPGGLKSWIHGRWTGWVDGAPFLRARLRRFLAAYHWARVDLILPPLEADIAITALQRGGWRLVASERGDPSTLVFAVRVRSAPTRASHLAAELGVALADARVRSIGRCTVDTDLPRYEQLEEWRTPLPEPGSGPRRGRPLITRARLFTPVQRPTDVLGSGSLCDAPTNSLERVGTTSDRLRAGVVAVRKARHETAGGIALSTVAGVILVATVAAIQVRWPGPRDARRPQSYLWLHDHKLLLILVAAFVLAGVAGMAAEVAPNRFKGVPRVLAFLLGAASLGGVVGGWTRLELSWGACAGVSFLFLVGWLWQKARFVKVQLVKQVVRLTSVAALLGLVSLYGRGRTWSYYGAMGVDPGGVDISAVRALLLAVRPVSIALLTMAVLLAVAWVASGHGPQFVGAALTLVAVAAGASLLLQPLATDQRRGRLVGTGLARFTAPKLGSDPGPTPLCLGPVDPDPAKAMANPLMLVWKLGTDGPYTLLLDPAAARRPYGQLPVDPAEQATHVPMNDVDAPIWYVPSGEVNLRHPVAGRCDA